MICKKCGQEVDAANKFCTHCGEPTEAVNNAEPVAVNVAQPTENATPNNFDYINAQPAMPKKEGKAAMGIMAVVAVVAVVLVVVLFSSVFGKSEKTPLNNIEKILNKKTTDIDKIVKDVTPGFMSDAYLEVIDILEGNDTYKDYVEDLYKEGEESLEDAWDDLYDSAEDEFGKNVKFSYKIEDKEKIDKKDLESVAEVYQEFGQYKKELVEIVEVVAEATELEDKEVKKLVKVVENLSDEFEKAKITKGYILEVEVTVEGKDDDDSESFDVVVTKMNGDWMIDPVMTAAIYADMDIDEIQDYYEDNYAEYVEEFADNLDDVIDMLEENIEELDDDVLEMFLDEMVSSL